MAEITHAAGNSSSGFHSSHEDQGDNLSTLPDPRGRTIIPSNKSSTPTTDHPDLNSEVATLSNKLIHAINYQTSLDDILSATRHELAAAQKRIKFLERENQKYLDLLAQESLVRKSVVDSIQAKMAASIAEERRKRVEIEDEKKIMEQELESLTAALFEEANKMVSNAREEARREVYLIQRKNEQLKAQIADNESLLKSQQDQLVELKQVMEQMTEEYDDQTNQTSPSSPGFSKSYSKGYQTDDTEITNISPFQEPATPTHPTNLTHLLQTVLRTDLPSYHEFISLLKMSRNNTIGKRASTGSYSGIGVSLGLAGHSGSSNNCSTSSTVITTSPMSTNTPTSTANSNIGHISTTSLKETKFYRRVLVEDIEPTLRLDSAPGLSWLARRTVMNAVCEATLIVEPMPSFTKNSNCMCALCGESRNEPDYTRNHRFKTSENENAQRYPLCAYCVGRLRSTCDFIGFLRIIKDGYWRCDDGESERVAWDESVRLREQMFWSRLGGGVVPVTQNHQHDILKSPFAHKNPNDHSTWQIYKNSGSECDQHVQNTSCSKQIHDNMIKKNHLQSPVNDGSKVLDKKNQEIDQDPKPLVTRLKNSQHEDDQEDDHERPLFPISGLSSS